MFKLHIKRIQRYVVQPVKTSVNARSSNRQRSAIALKLGTQSLNSYKAILK